MPDVVQRGKLVTPTYSIADDQDNVVEQHDLPLSFVYGGDTELIGGVDEAILGKQAGDEVLVELPAGQAFGAHDPALTFTDDLANVPPQFSPAQFFTWTQRIRLPRTCTQCSGWP